MQSVAQRSWWAGAHLGDKILTIPATFLAALYTLTAMGTPQPASILEAVTSWCFVPFFWLWRSRPGTSALGFSACLTVWALNWLSYLPENRGVSPWLLTAPLAVYATARHCTDRRIPRAVLAVMYLGSFISPVMWQFTEDLEFKYATALDAMWIILAHWSLLTATYFAGARYRGRELQRLAEQQQRLEKMKNAQEEERLLIARELHDVLAHSLTLMKVQAQAGLVAAKTDDKAAVAALEEIRAVSDGALTEVRSIVSALRGDDTLRLQPTGQSGDIPGIIAGFEAAGLTIEAELSAESLELPALIHLAVTRIISESLTNVVRHQGATAKVKLVVSCGNQVDIEIDSWGAAQDSSGTGSRAGLIGLAERARSLGGSFHASGTPEAFSVRATLPLRGA